VLLPRALVEAYSGGHSSDGKQSAQSNATHTPPEFWLHGKTMEVSDHSQFGMTCERLTEDRGEELLTSFRAAFLVKTSPSPEAEQASTEREAGSGQRWHESSVRYDLDACSWKTHRTLFDEVLPESSVTLPLSGMMRDGVVYQPWKSERLTEEIDSGSLLPTPVASDIHHRKTKYAQGGSALSFVIGGPLSPNWVEWLMGWPIGWTDLNALETGKFHQWQQQHGDI